MNNNDIQNRYRGYRGRDNSLSRPRPHARPKPAAPRNQQNSQSTPQTHTDPLQYAVSEKTSNFQPPPKASSKKRSKKPLLIILVVLLVITIAGGAYWWFVMKNDSKSNSYSLGDGERNPPGEIILNGEKDEETLPAGGTLRLVATGDMIAHDTVNDNARKADGTYDYLQLMDKMKPFFTSADIRFCNQATPAGGEEFGISGYPVFNAPVAFARGIEAVGCNVINIGTNHTNDKGQPLIDATAAAWDDREGVLAVAGANRTVSEQSRVRYFTVKGVKFAFVTYTTYSNSPPANNFGINMYNDTLAKTQLTEARKNAEYVIASMRWGTEYSPEVNAQQDEIAQKLADFGADVVFGHGPHVLEPVKKLKSVDERDVYVWYSLGNFLNTQLETEALIGGFAVMDIDIASKKVTKVAFMPTYMHYDWTAQEKAAGNLLARKNLEMVPLDKAGDLLAKSLLGTTVEAQTERIKNVLNKYTEVPIITSTEY